FQAVRVRAVGELSSFLNEKFRRRVALGHQEIELAVTIHVGENRVATRGRQTRDAEAFGDVREPKSTFVLEETVATVGCDEKIGFAVVVVVADSHAPAHEGLETVAL